jgi:transcriptional regulator with XRE-family HTH domain
VAWGYAPCATVYDPERPGVGVRLAKAAKVTPGYIAQLEMGLKKNPSLAVLKRIAKALGVPVTDPLEIRNANDGKSERAMSVKHTATVLVAVALTGCALTSPEERVRSACAWVLWSATPGPPSPDPYRAIVFFPRAAYDTPDQCEKGRARQEETTKPELGIYLCLPDTVDPRGPKGSAR